MTNLEELAKQIYIQVLENAHEYYTELEADAQGVTADYVTNGEIYENATPEEVEQIDAIIAEKYADNIQWAFDAISDSWHGLKEELSQGKLNRKPTYDACQAIQKLIEEA